MAYKRKPGLLSPSLGGRRDRKRSVWPDGFTVAITCLYQKSRLQRWLRCSAVEFSLSDHVMWAEIGVAGTGQQRAEMTKGRRPRLKEHFIPKHPSSLLSANGLCISWFTLAVSVVISIPVSEWSRAGTKTLRDSVILYQITLLRDSKKSKAARSFFLFTTIPMKGQANTEWVHLCNAVKTYFLRLQHAQTISCQMVSLILHDWFQHFCSCLSFCFSLIWYALRKVLLHITHKQYFNQKGNNKGLEVHLRLLSIKFRSNRTRAVLEMAYLLLHALFALILNIAHL